MKDIIQPYYIIHKKKFENFTVCILWKKNDVIINNTSVPSKITLEKPCSFKSSLIEMPIVVRVSPLEFLDTFDRNINNKVDEINILFVSALKDITFFHYMDQPKTML